MRYLILRLAGPLMAFGGPRIDEYGSTLSFPTTSMIAGLLANALGFERQEHRKIDAFQDRITIAARIDRRGSIMADYQTARLDQVLGHDAYGRDKKVTHVAHREFIADGIVTVAVFLDQPDGPGEPTIEDVEIALMAPARPLFLGRANCPPSEPLLIGIIEADTHVDALIATPRHPRADPGPLPGIWPPVPGARSGEIMTIAGDRRDTSNGIGVGRTTVTRGDISPVNASPATANQERTHV